METQRQALQPVGTQRRPANSLGSWGPLLGPHPLLWHWKQHIDRRFIQRLQPSAMGTKTSADSNQMLCRGCAAKLPAATLEAALSIAGVGGLATAPEDAAVMPTKVQGEEAQLLQSVDGFH